MTEDCKDCEDRVTATDAGMTARIERVREGRGLRRRERAELETWLALRTADYLAELTALLRAPSEIPQDVET